MPSRLRPARALPVLGVVPLVCSGTTARAQTLPAVEVDAAVGATSHPRLPLRILADTSGARVYDRPPGSSPAPVPICIAPCTYEFPAGHVTLFAETAFAATQEFVIDVPDSGGAVRLRLAQAERHDTVLYTGAGIGTAGFVVMLVFAGLTGLTGGTVPWVNEGLFISLGVAGVGAATALVGYLLPTTRGQYDEHRYPATGDRAMRVFPAVAPVAFGFGASGGLAVTF